jgi:trans-2,3-dihydro-3-hydroxyanthranilate isomerase
MARFYILDVFAEQRYAGNQLAVIRDGDRFSDEEMQQLAREFNFSETTFILNDNERDGAFDVRIFTPARELPFAGHPTLGTAYVIQREILGREVAAVTLNLKAGRIPVDFTYQNDRADELTMQQLPPEFGKQIDPARIAPVLRLEEGDIDSRFPLLEVSTGVFDVMVPLRTLEAQKRVSIDIPKYYDLIETLEAKAILTFCPETYDPDCRLNVRMFAHYFGVPEDPATGSANGCLAAYLVKERYFDADAIDIRVEQGIEIGRPSVLHLTAHKTAEGIDVRVGGRVVKIGQGELTT